MLHQLLQRPLTEAPHHTVMEFEGRCWSATELEETACRLAAALMDAGIETMDRIAVLLPNCPEAVFCYLACFKAQFVMVPLDYRHRPAQIAYAMNHSGATTLVVHHERLEELDGEGILKGVPRILVVGSDARGSRGRSFGELLARGGSSDLPDTFRGSDLCVMIYTSGTTSRPKGVTLTREAITAGISKYLARVPMNREDIALIAAPVTRPMALRSQLLPTLSAGGRVCLVKGFTVDGFLAAMRQTPSKTCLALLPAALGQLLAHPDVSRDDFKGLRLCIAGGDRVPQRLHEEFLRITGVELTEQCGASEVGFYAINPPFGRKKPGSIGLPMYGASVCVVDDHGSDVPTNTTGEIVVSSPMMMEGYWNDTAQTRKTIVDGRVRTGDLGRFDDDGYLWFTGRKKDIIVRGGSNISPLEVESVLLEHPGVAEACVVGALHPTWGQTVHAYVVLRPGQMTTSETLLGFSRGRLAEYMVPEQIEILDAMPVKGAGKTDRELLRIRSEIWPLVETIPFFRNAGGDLIRAIAPCLTEVEFSPGETIFRKGDVGDAMYFLTRGQVEVVAEPSGKQMAVLSEGSHFGEVAVLADAPRLATVRALAECELYELRRPSVLELTRSFPEFARHVEEALSEYMKPGQP